MNPSKRERAVKLRDAGMIYPEIARCLGVSTSTAQRWCKPDLAERHRVAARAWKDAHREQNRARDRATMHRPCPNCGGPMRRQNSQCSECYGATVIVRRSIIQGAWLDGWMLSEIAAIIGTTARSLAVTMVRMRRDGWELPYRYHVKDGTRVAA